MLLSKTGQLRLARQPTELHYDTNKTSVPSQAISLEEQKSTYAYLIKLQIKCVLVHVHACVCKKVKSRLCHFYEYSSSKNLSDWQFIVSTPPNVNLI